MANNYSQFSEQILEDVEDEEAALAFLKDELGDVDDLEYWPNFGWMIESNLKDSGDTHSIWLYSDEGCDFNHVMAFVQALIRKFMPDYIFSLTNSDTCSKLRTQDGEPRAGGRRWLMSRKRRETNCYYYTLRRRTTSTLCGYVTGLLHNRAWSKG